MKRFVSIFLLLFTAAISTRAALTNFTYQGRLTSSGSPANGAFEMHFTLFDAPTNGVPLAAQTLAPVPVTNGLFTVSLDFGSNHFTGEPR